MKDAGAQLLAEDVLPAYKGVQAERKIYSAPPQFMDRRDAELTSLGPGIGVPHIRHRSPAFSSNWWNVGEP